MCLMLLGALTACSSRAVLSPPPGAQLIPDWILDPSLHPHFSRGTHLTASATADSAAAARLRAQVAVLLQLGGVEAALARTEECETDQPIEVVAYRPWPISWRYIQLEEGRFGDVYFAFAAIDRTTAGDALRSAATQVQVVWNEARARALEHRTPENLLRARLVFSLYAGLLLELANVEANRSRLRELHADFARLQHQHARACAGVSL